MAKRLTDEEILSQIPSATKRAQDAAAREPRAKSAHYDHKSRCVSIELSNGASFRFPADLGQGLRGASADDLEEVEVSPSGLGLHWERLNVDLLVPSLLLGMFGTKTWMRELAREGGRSTSDAKTAAARANGLKGGRPRKATKQHPPLASQTGSGMKCKDGRAHKEFKVSAVRSKKDPQSAN